jgi:hypothetical protein
LHLLSPLFLVSKLTFSNSKPHQSEGYFLITDTDSHAAKNIFAVEASTVG